MIDSPARKDAASDARRAWIVGGVLLIAATVFEVIFWPVAWQIPGYAFVGSLLYAASLLFFAFGIRGSGSVTARRPLGTGALTFLAAWAIVGDVLWSVVPVDLDRGLQLVIGTAGPLLEGAVALVAVVQIARAGAVPRPWNWAPTWALAAIATPWVLQLLLAAALPAPPQDLIMMLVTMDSLVRVGSAVFLGVLAIVLAKLSSRSRTVAIYPVHD